MPDYGKAIKQPMKHDADFSSSEYIAVKFSSGAGDLEVCGAGELACGILSNVVNDGSTTETASTVQIGGLVVGIAGGAVTAGTMVMSNASGKLVTATTGNYAIGQAMEDATADVEFNVSFGPCYHNP